MTTSALYSLCRQKEAKRKEQDIYPDRKRQEIVFFISSSLRLSHVCDIGLLRETPFGQ